MPVLTEWTESIDVRVSDSDASGRWRRSAILTVMQEMGETQAGQMGLGRHDLVPRGMCWVLYRQRLVLNRLPQIGDRVRMTTWPGEANGLFFPRYFSFEDESGAPIGEAATSWVLFDLAKRRVLRPSALHETVKVNTARTCSLPLPGAIDVGELAPAETRIVRATELDVNGHMNNARYADWAQDALTSLGAEMPSGSLQINYLTEARLHDEIELFARVAPDATCVVGRRRDDAHAMFEVEARAGCAP